MDYQSIFERVEAKYMLTRQQYLELMERCKDHLQPNIYPHSDITSIYLDSYDYRLVRSSLDKPAFKEKLRLRCYGEIKNDDAPVFMEIKKKYKGVVYKRRQDMTYRQAMNYLLFDRMPVDSQIMREIDWLRNSEAILEPRVIINYQHDSYDGIEEKDLRITFDTDIRFSLDNLTLKNRNLKECILDDSMIIMEIKTLTAMPLWLVETLSELSIYPHNFSKYGEIYRQYISKGGIRKCSVPYLNQYTVNSVLPHISSAPQPAYY